MALPKILKEPWPFGALMMAHWLLPLSILITMWPLPGGFINAISWFALATSFVQWTAIVFGYQSKAIKLSGRYVLIPYLLIDVILAGLYSVLFLMSAYSCYSFLALIDIWSSLFGPSAYVGLKPRVIIATPPVLERQSPEKSSAPSKRRHCDVSTSAKRVRASHASITNGIKAGDAIEATIKDTMIPSMSPGESGILHQVIEDNSLDEGGTN